MQTHSEPTTFSDVYVWEFDSGLFRRLTSRVGVRWVHFILFKFSRAFIYSKSRLNRFTNNSFLVFFFGLLIIYRPAYRDVYNEKLIILTLIILTLIILTLLNPTLR